ncbi:hypothetical protein AB0L33_32885 [Streptomyces sp. NPDC052299]|uniref:hypothetical protein n=1 Tax=Streptomyces sp. NPDC052299 TaxID=3155054 RepID=UPI003428A6D7
MSSLLLALACLLLYMGLPNLGGALHAATVDGVPGTFTARRLSCVSHPGHETCEWIGTFRSADGTVARTAARLYGSDRDSLTAGKRTSALDIGNPQLVYSSGGSYQWVFVVAMLIAGYALLWLLARRHLMPPREKARP